MSYNRWMTKKIVFIAVSAIWLVSGLVSFVPISLGWHKPSVDSTSLPNPSVGPSVSSNMTQALDVELTSGRPQCALDLTPTYAVVSSTIR